jgi:hypothetical protein
MVVIKRVGERDFPPDQRIYAWHKVAQSGNSDASLNRLYISGQAAGAHARGRRAPAGQARPTGNVGSGLEAKMAASGILTSKVHACGRQAVDRAGQHALEVEMSPVAA